jgi:hypothetical protein
MAEEHVAVLRRVREAFVRKRRAMAEQMIPEGAAAAHFAPSFANLQAAIEAIDRAIQDEASLPPGYARADEHVPADARGNDSTDRSNVVDVDFD